ncbi:MAG: hypothetical protein A3J66_02360 [Candidatus Magasanikbacteria bacterium RIFCSPHIGHO2_02_FULL_47_14]|uniref:Amidohydrolase 3 domain-containing protein n=1 Tax=Candidatus Magasanikbacteria bacterium RIFCSPHIGHO2_02_FULL_47_14 TaxID=1798680 RepID=A0A1F6M1H0_9BACT|nr:MAG: hypothetical protein A3J66_02360 [Candidatus Magasanikbacteria bacterium RIFCSPHIGHO2_02_FULL_47_14]
MQSLSKILFNGHFYLGNNQWAENIGISKEGSIVLDTASFSGPRIDMRSRYIYPAFEDAHNHPARRSRTLQEVDLRGQSLTWPEVKIILQEKIAQTPAGQWVVCHGWNQAWGSVTQQDVNELSHDHGIFIIHISYHGALVNKKGLDLLAAAGLRCNTRDGVLHEDIFEQAENITAPNTQTYIDLIRRYQERLVRKGLGAVHDLYVANMAQVEAYHELEHSGKLLLDTPIYVGTQLLQQGQRLQPFVRPAARAPIVGLKLFIDGTIGTRTAAFHDSYCDVANKGMVRLTKESCKEYIKKAADLGLTHIAMHCIGDEGIDRAVDWFQEFQSEFGSAITTWRFEHFEMPTPHAIEALAQHGGIASMQPNFLWDAVHYQQAVGDRVKNINPFQSLIQAGVPIIFGSDDVPTGPLEGLAWTCAQAPYPNQALTVEQAFAFYTSEPARIVKADHRGRIAPGYDANLVVLDTNIFSGNAADLTTAEVSQTWIRGEKVWDSPSAH